MTTSTRVALGLLATSSLMSCASVVDGTMERAEAVTFTSEPTGAIIKAAGAKICTTPCRPRVTRYQMKRLSAEFSGFKTVQFRPSSQLDGTTTGNIVFGGFVGLGLDILSGSAKSYEDSVHIVFTEKSE